MQTAPDFLPAEAYESDIAILGRKGRGKSFTAKGIAETLLERHNRLMVIDPLGIWWGLRVASDGKGKGYDVAIFGGEHGDIELHVDMARPLAQLFARQNTPVVFDLSDFSRKEQNTFVTALLDELMKCNREALTLILEEADLFAPQNPMPDTTHVLYQVDRVARRGRAFGFRLITITQRPAKLHKDVLTQLSTLIALGVTSPQDRDALKAWVEGNADRDKAKEVYNSLASLKVGEGWVWAPDFDLLKRVQFPKIKTLDTSKTPKAGETKLEVKRLEELDLSAIREQLAELQKPNEKPVTKSVAVQQPVPDVPRLIREAEEPLKRRIAELEQQIEKLNALSWTLQSAIKGAREMLEVEVLGTAMTAEEFEASKLLASTPSELTVTSVKEPPRVVVTGVSKGRLNYIDEDAKLSPSAEKILGVLTGIYPRGLSYASAAARAGVSKRSSGYRVYRKELVEGGYVSEREGKFVASEHVLGSVPSVPHSLEGWYSKLTPSESNILRVLKHTAGWLDKKQIARQANISETSSGLGASLKELLELGLIEKRNGEYRLVEDLR